MKLKDLEGKPIVVTDLEAAIQQADEYRMYIIEGEENRLFSIQRQTYWQDIYEKLIGLRKRKRSRPSQL